MVFTGGAFPALQFVSSNAFGLDKLSSGLTKYELRQMSSLKIYTSVLLENCPQLIFQILYAYTTSVHEGDEVTSTVKFAFLATLLSAISAILTYFINRDDNKIEMEVVQYRLALECDRTPDGMEVGTNDIGKEEQQKIRKYRGLREKLSRYLTRFWNSLVSLPSLRCNLRS